jgi:hypothetical protein
VYWVVLWDIRQLTSVKLHRDSLGDSAVAGDFRWAGTYGVDMDFVARSHCSVAVIGIEEIQVRYCIGAHKHIDVSILY